MAFVNKQGGVEKQNETAGAGEMLDFDPNDDSIVKVHYDVTVWSFDQQAELAEAMAEANIPHAWDGTELVVPEDYEDRVDAIFERLEQELGPFPIVLGEDEPSTEFGLDEWTDADRALLTESLVVSGVRHRWEASTVVVAEDAEDAVDDLLDAIESGELAEQIEGGVLDGRSDLFALGVVLYHCATGNPAFPGDTTASVMRHVVSTDPVPSTRSMPRLPKWFHCLLLSLLAKDPRDRFKDARALDRAIERAHEEGDKDADS